MVCSLLVISGYGTRCGNLDPNSKDIFGPSRGFIKYLVSEPYKENVSSEYNFFQPENLNKVSIERKSGAEWYT